jgi:hypothetical protein
MGDALPINEGPLLGMVCNEEFRLLLLLLEISLLGWLRTSLSLTGFRRNRQFNPKGSPMSFFDDMGHRSMVASGDHVRAIGWLHPDHAYTKGEVSAEFLNRLKELIARPSLHGDEFHFPGFGGIHTCEFCGQAHGGGNFAVPSDNLLFIFPDMVVHYVETHGYKPPAEFVAAVLHSPLPDTEEFHLLTEPFWHLHRHAQERQYQEAINHAGRWASEQGGTSEAVAEAARRFFGNELPDMCESIRRAMQND